MKKAFLFLGVLLLIVVGYVLFILSSTGFFRSIPTTSAGTVVQSIPLPGVEDLQILQAERVDILSFDDRKSRRDGLPAKGGLYYLDLSQPTLEATPIAIPIEDFRPHGISLYQVDSRTYKLFVINHSQGKHTIEEFILKGDQAYYQRSYAHELMVSPNDLVAVSASQFYFTNDHKHLSGFPRFLEDYGGAGKANVVFFDGTNFKEVAGGIAYANGINYDTERRLLFVGSSRGFLVKVYEAAENGNLEFVEDIPIGSGADNLEFDDAGNLLVGCHPNLMAFANYAKGKSEYSPSEIIQITYFGKNKHQISSLFIDDGQLVSASSVAGRYQDYLIIGNVMDNEVLVWKNINPK